MAKNAAQITQELGNYGKLIGNHSMRGGIKALKLAVVVAAAAGLTVGFIIGKNSK